MNTELQQRIIKQATRMFLCNGIKSVTMDMIASQLGISKRTLYENFKKKNELLLACLESQEMERRARLEVYFANRKNVIDLLLNVYEDILRFMRNTSPMFFVDMERYYPRVNDKYENDKECHKQATVDLLKEGVGEGVGQGPDGSGAQDGPCVGGGELRAVARHQTPCQVGDGPEQEQDAECAGDGVHAVHRHAHKVRVAGGEERRQARQHHEQRGAGRVPDFEFIGGCNEFRAVPEARNRFHRHQVYQCGDGKDRPADDVVPAFEGCHIFSVCFALCPAKVII